MAAAILWYPRYQPLKKITLSQEFSEISEGEEVDAVESESISGRLSRIVYSTRRLVRVVSELVTDTDDAHELMALVSHLRGGGLCMVAEDQTKILGCFARGWPNAGDTILHLRDNIYDLGVGWTPSADEVLYLRGPSPRGLQEPVVCSGSGSARAPVLSTSPRHDWKDQRWVFVHNARFWPILRLQRGRHSDPLLVSERRIHYTLDLPLEESPWSLERIAIAPDWQLQGETFEEGVPNLEQVLRGGFSGYSEGKEEPGPGSAPIGPGGWY